MTTPVPPVGVGHVDDLHRVGSVEAGHPGCAHPAIVGTVAGGPVGEPYRGAAG